MRNEKDPEEKMKLLKELQTILKESQRVLEELHKKQSNQKFGGALRRVLIIPDRNFSTERILATSTDLELRRCQNPRRGVDQNTRRRRKVKFIYQELPADGAFLTAQLAGNEVVYSVVLTKARNPLVVKMLKAILSASFQRGSALILEHSPQSYIFRNCAKWD
jgi:hypothetical protein